MKVILISLALIFLNIIVSPESSCALSYTFSHDNLIELTSSQTANPKKMTNTLMEYSIDMQIKTNLVKKERNHRPDTTLIKKNVMWVVIIISIFVLCWALVMRLNRKKLLRQEKKFRDLFELSQDGVLLRRLDADIFYDCNQAMLDMLGYSDKQKFLQLGPKGIVFSKQPDGKVIDELLEEANAIIQQKKKNRFEGLFKRKDGTPMHAEVVACLVDIDSKPTIQSVIRDMSVSKKREDNLRKLSRAVEASSAAILITDSDGNVEYVNPKFTELTGYSLEEVEGLNPRFLQSGEHDQQYYKDLWDTILAGNDWHGTLLNKKKNGEKYWVSASISSVADENNRITNFVGVQDDITSMKRMEVELLEAKQSADEANMAKSDFLARMSHEIRTPMNAIIGMNHLALQTDLSYKQKDYISKAHGAARSLLGILNDILDFSKIEAGKLQFERVEFNLEEVFDNLASVVALSAAEKRIELLFLMTPQTPHHLVGDPLRLQQVLTNLVNNAIKFTEKGEILISVEPVSKLDQKIKLFFKVEDSGIGLSESQIAKLFQSFSQADGSTTRKYGGSGLGLVICKRLVEMMGGTIEVESAPGKGSTFSFTSNFETVPGKEENKPILPENLRGKRVLVVDDSRVSRRILAKALEQQSLLVETAESGETGLEMVSKSRGYFDIILMDWNLPGINGIDTAKRILSHKENSGIKIIMVTAFGREDIARQAKSVGMKDFLVKPVSNAVLVEAIMAAFGYQTKTKPEGEDQKEVAKKLRSIQGASVLLVEDNELNIQIATELLQSVKLLVTVANDGAEAVELVREKEFDIILMDIQMPVMDGISATRLIRQEQKNLPIIAMTASAMTADKEESLTAGMNDHVAKPIDPSHLYQVLLQWVPFGKKKPPGESSPTMSKIDTQTGLKNTGGNRELYLGLLAKFAQEQKNIVQEIEEALISNDYTRAKRLAHTIKGLSGSIGAHDLQLSCENLESGLNNINSEKTPSLLEAMKHELTGAIDSINKTAERKPKTQKRKKGDPSLLPPLLSELSVNIEKRNPTTCKEIISQIEEFTWPEKIQEQVDNLTILIGKYRYKEAMPLVLQIQHMCAMK